MTWDAAAIVAGCQRLGLCYARPWNECGWETALRRRGKRPSCDVACVPKIVAHMQNLLFKVLVSDDVTAWRTASTRSPVLSRRTLCFACCVALLSAAIPTCEIVLRCCQLPIKGIFLFPTPRRTVMLIVLCHVAWWVQTLNLTVHPCCCFAAWQWVLSVHCRQTFCAQVLLFLYTIGVAQ